MKKYYSVRNGINHNFSGFNLDVLKKLILDLYIEFENKGYFQEYFGYYCVDQDFVSGLLGQNIDAQIYRLLRKDNIWPISEKMEQYSEDDLFDVIELLFDNISKPIDGVYHQYNQCGWHYSKFNQNEGRREFLEKINDILSEYGSGFKIDQDGIILVKDEKELSSIYSADIPTNRSDVKIKMELAAQKYRQSRSNLEERRIAIRELADVLETLKKDVEKYLNKKDESDLFNLANNFAIRHSNDKQRTEYDKDIWYSWMFYFYISTIHALLRIKERAEKVKKK